MDATSFELAVSMPREERYADAVRRLAVEAAQYAGCPSGQEDQFAQTVEEAFHSCLGSPAPEVPIVFRRASGPLEVHVDGRVLTLAI
jgi:hypothetical protein